MVSAQIMEMETKMHPEVLLRVQEASAVSSVMMTIWEWEKRMR